MGDEEPELHGDPDLPVQGLHVHLPGVPRGIVSGHELPLLREPVQVDDVIPAPLELRPHGALPGPRGPGQGDAHAGTNQGGLY